MAEQAPVRTGGMPPCRGQFQPTAVDGGDSANPADLMPSQSGLQSLPSITVPIEVDADLVGEHFVDGAARPRHVHRTGDQIGGEICTSRFKDAEAPARPPWFVRRWWVVEYATNQRSSYSRRTPFREVQFRLM